MNNGILPNHSSAVEEKLHRSNASVSWTRPVSLPIPGVRTRRLRILVPNVVSFPELRSLRVRRTRAPVLCFACLALIMMVILVSRAHESRKWSENWPPSNGDSSTLVFRREDLQRIWKWEIASGHYPSRQTSTWPTYIFHALLNSHSHSPVPRQIGLKTSPINPAIPRQARTGKTSRYRSPAEDLATETYGVGPKRVYLDNQSQYPNVAYPPRPVPGSVADMDVIMKHCNFSTGKVCRVVPYIHFF
jgi:WD repeat and SOF domain-containing protein 1